MIQKVLKWFGKSFSYHQSYQKEQVDSTDVDWMLIKRLMQYIQPYRNLLVISLFLMIFSKGVEAFVPIRIGSITQEILDSRNLLAEGDRAAVFAQVITGCWGVIAMLGFSYLLDLLNIYIKSKAGQKAMFTLRTQVFSHIQTLPIAYFDHHPVGRLMTRTIHDVEQIDLMFSESVVPIIGNSLLLIGIFVGILWIDWRLAILIVAVFPLVWILAQQFRHKQRRCYEMVRSILSAMNGFIQEHLMGSSTVRLFGLQTEEKKKFEVINDDYRIANIESIYNFAFFMAAIEFLHNLVLIGVFAILVIWASPIIGFQAGTFFTFSLYALMIFRPIGDLAERYNVLQSAIAAARRIFNVLDQPVEKTPEVGQESLESVENIVFEDVWFGYEKDNWVLKGVSFELKKGKKVALVGMTGGGKTTILSLLLRFYELSRGTIKINGKDIREYPLHELRSKFSIVLQDPVIFSGTIADNIALFQKAISKKKIEEAVDYVNLRPFVKKFPEGIEHELAERGIGLSAGELQLVSLARAVAHEGRVLVLDEATANIDVGNERIIQEALRKVLSVKTALVIAHRLTTVHEADLILVMHQGTIRERGTHEELMQAKGTYEKLYRLQFENGFRAP